MDHHLLYLGLEVRVELTLEDGQHHWAQLTREHAWRRGLDRGKQVHVRISHSKSFVNAAEGSLQKS